VVEGASRTHDLSAADQAVRLPQDLIHYAAEVALDLVPPAGEENPAAIALLVRAPGRDG